MGNSRKKKVAEPSWLVHFHYGRNALPLTVYDNHDGTFTFADDRTWLRNVSAEEALRALTLRMNELVLSNQKLTG